MKLEATTLTQHPLGPVLVEVLQAALRAADPYAAVRRGLHVEGRAIVVAGRSYEQAGRVVVVGAGKAGAPMAQAAYDALGERISGGLVIVKEGHLGAQGQAAAGPVALLEGEHPVPGPRGAAAAASLEALVGRLGPDDLLLALISGGGSALLTLPAPGLALDDLRAMTAALLRCGATIDELNTLRRRCTRLSGGRLARRAGGAHVATLIISDVVGSPLDVIASGPTAPDPSTFADAWAVVERYELQAALPQALLAHLGRGLRGELAESVGVDDPLWGRVQNVVIASNEHAALAALAAAQERGLNALLLTTYLEGEAREVGRVAAALARELALRERPLPRPALLIAGGETTVQVRGDGLGGRNQELALGAVAGLAGLVGVLLVTLATDGGDGPTDAAGAVVDGATLERARRLGLDLAGHLARNDAHPFFATLDDLLRPGPTLTNVNDLLFILAA